MSASHIVSGIALAVVGATTTQTSPDIPNRYGNNLEVFVVTTAIGTGSITVSINAKDPASGTYILILASAAIITNTTTKLEVGPELTAATNAVARDLVPSVLQIVATANNANPASYSVGYILGV